MIFKHKAMKAIFILTCLSLAMVSKAVAAPNPNSLPNRFLVQTASGGVPNSHAAVFHFLNPNGDPIAEHISLGTAFSGESVILDSGEAAFARLGWFMFYVDDCESQIVREVIDFESVQCRVPHEDQADADTRLNTIASLPEECLAPAAEDPCGVFESVLRYEFATSQQKAREILKNELTQSFLLDGDPLPPTRTLLKPFKYIVGTDPEFAPAIDCSQELYYSPLLAYGDYNYQISPQTGGCFLKSSAVLLPPLNVGEHELLFVLTLGGEPFDFPPVTIIQN